MCSEVKKDQSAYFNNKKGYAFISYSTKNQDTANEIHKLLREDGISTWMAPGDIPAGRKYAQVINRAVKDCACFVLILTEDSQCSIWVAKETERAVNYRKPIIPVQLGQVELNDEFELYISTDQIVNIQSFDKYSEKVKRFISGVGAFTGKAPTKEYVKVQKNYQTENPLFGLSNPEIMTRLLFVVDTSNSMEGERINVVNNAIEKTKRVFDLHFGNHVAVDVLKYNTECSWINDTKTKLIAEGVSNFGKALKLIVEYGTLQTKDSVNCIILIANSYSNDEYREILGELKNQEWFHKACRFVFALGEDVDYGSLYKFTENRDLVIEMSDMHDFERICSSLSLMAIKTKKSSYHKYISSIDILKKFNEENEERKHSAVTTQGNWKQATILKETKSEKEEQQKKVYYFGPKRAKQMYMELPAIVRIPVKTDIILSYAFHRVTSGKIVMVDEVIVPERVREIKSNAFSHLRIRKKLSLPKTLKLIGNDAFSLIEDAYVVCEIGTVAYEYCKERGIRTSADMKIWRQYGRCQFCGGEFSLILKKCKNCGRKKNY